jgi:hypothetical protein
VAKFTVIRAGNLGAKVVRHLLQTVADPKHGKTLGGEELPHTLAQVRRTLLVDRRWSARKDDALDIDVVDLRREIFSRHRACVQLAVHFRLTHAPRDQVRVLRAKVDWVAAAAVRRGREGEERREEWERVERGDGGDVRI